MSLTGGSVAVRKGDRRGNLTKLDIAREVARSAEIPRVHAERAVEVVIDALRVSLCEGRRIELRGFGVFLVRPRKLGIARNVRTGQVVPPKPGRTVRFKAGKLLQELSPTAPPGSP